MSLWNNPLRLGSVPPALALLLSACVVGPNFQRPAAPTASAYTAAPAPSTELTPQLGAGPPQDWWTLLHSKQLNDTMQLALRDNHDLRAAQQALVQARELASASTGARYPEIDLDASAGRQKLGAASLGSIVFPPFTYYSIGPAVSYTLDYTGGVKRAIEAQGAHVDYEKYELDAAYLSLTGNVALQALDIASTRAQLKTLETLLSQDADNLKLVQAAFEAGSVSRVDELSAQTQLANDETLRPALLQQLSAAKHRLSVLAGRLPADWSAPAFELEELAPPPALPLAMPSELVRRRPDILAAEAQLHEANPTSAWRPRTCIRTSPSPARPVCRPPVWVTCSIPPAAPAASPAIWPSHCTITVPCARASAPRSRPCGARARNTSRPC